MKARTYAVAAGGLFVVTLAAVQFSSLKRLESEMASLRRQIGEPSAGMADAPPAGRFPDGASGAPDARLARRVADLEQAVARFTKASEYLMERGQLPSGEEHLAKLQAQFLDSNADANTRLRALRVLRRNRGMNDEVVNSAIGWLETATDPRMKRDLLGQLEGVTNAALKAPLLGLLAKETNGDVREQAVESLRAFVGDSQVEDLLWQLARTDPNEDVRDQAEEALREAPMTETRTAALRQRALDPQAPLDERLIAMRALNDADVEAPEVMKAMAELVQGTQDPVERARLFRALDGVNDPSLMVPLVNGLQDANPVVREEAVDALSGFSKEPAIAQWLR
ncbi:MAG TPA: HEAT repeat domain-containing protein, partial [Verrucomicrobiae bacterium]|nr:HEAT repeat domain-containing protein [Verrucomicrobiae bacterium]